MATKNVITGTLMDENVSSISFVQVCQTYHIQEDMLVELLEHGLLDEIKSPIKQAVFNPSMLQRIQSARRLHEDLGVNLPGVVLVLELHDELDKIRRELDILRRHFGDMLG